MLFWKVSQCGVWFNIKVPKTLKLYIKTPKAKHPKDLCRGPPRPAGWMYITLAKGQAMLQNTQHTGTADVRQDSCWKTSRFVVPIIIKGKVGKARDDCPLFWGDLVWFVAGKKTRDDLNVLKFEQNWFGSLRNFSQSQSKSLAFRTLVVWW